MKYTNLILCHTVRVDSDVKNQRDNRLNLRKYRFLIKYQDNTNFKDKTWYLVDISGSKRKWQQGSKSGATQSLLRSALSFPHYAQICYTLCPKKTLNFKEMDRERSDSIVKNCAFEKIPNEIIYKILNYLKPYDLFSCNTVNKRWNHLIYETKLHTKCKYLLNSSMNQR